MRIDAYNQVSQLYQTTKPKKVTRTGGTAVTERYQVSRSGKDYQVAKSALNEISDVREDKVQGFKDALASGTYNVSSQEIAESMVSRFFDSVY